MGIRALARCTPQKTDTESLRITDFGTLLQVIGDVFLWLTSTQKMSKDATLYNYVVDSCLINASSRKYMDGD